ncbi:hypothetical protein QN277_028298 [Acacia crassicarpa]|uniref:Uncharacterized protein n=1 Tax=Acacia crassicarpa TaxID=499986 RepID=A0AAE1J4I1_9FABA|nr:hypothetical protein QN277_028298 [Acacia crassicarpa]
MRIFIRISIKFRNARSSPEPIIKGSLHIVRYKRRSTQRTSSLIVTHPTVQTPPVINVPTVGEPSDLVVGLELVETDGAAIRRVHQVAELGDWKDFSDEHGRHRVEFGYRVGPNNVRLQKIVDTQTAKDNGDELSDETEKRKDVKEYLGEDEVGVTHRKSHYGGARSG